MPEYLFCTLDENGDLEECLGHSERSNSYDALCEVTNNPAPFEEYHPDEIIAFVPEEKLSGREVQQGAI